MARWLIRWILNIAGIVLAAYIIQGFDVTPIAAVVGSVLLGLVNAVIRPFVILITLPINLLTLGLFTLVINGFMLWLVSILIKGFDIQNFFTAILAALLITIISSLISFFVKD